MPDNLPDDIAWRRLHLARYRRRLCVPAEAAQRRRVGGLVAERGFGLLKAPIRRVTRAHVPVPYATELEAEIVPDAGKIAAAVRQVLGRA